MASEKSPINIEKMKKELDNVNEHTDIRCLLDRYDKPYERKYIQKYVEIQMNYISNKITTVALLFSIIAVFVTLVISYTLVLDSQTTQKNETIIYGIIFWFLLIIVSAIIIGRAIHDFCKLRAEKDYSSKLKMIAIAIEDEKLRKKIQHLSETEIEANHPQKWEPCAWMRVKDT